MKCKWTIFGGNWKWVGDADSDEDPCEIVTLALEEVKAEMGIKGEFYCLDDGPLPFNFEFEFGLFFKAFNSEMKGLDEHLFFASPPLLADAGMYEESSQMTKIYDGIESGEIEL